MKKTVKIILLISILFFIKQSLFSQTDPLSGDFGICRRSGYNIYVTMEAASVPFEGITNPKPNYGDPVNRVDQIQNGSYWRFYSINNEPTIKRNIAFITGEDLNTGNNNPFLDFGHCSGKEYPDVMNVAWGFAKYKITIKVIPASEPEIVEIFKFYLNSLDSKYLELDNGGYGADLYISYEPGTYENSSRIKFVKNQNPNGFQTIGYIYTTDILNGEPTKEYKVWEVVSNPPCNPTKDFYAKTTPFPICPRLIRYQHMRTLELGTDVTLDGVWSYNGDNDKYGYNTIDTTAYDWSHNYYSSPPIPSGTNDPGKTFVTPASFYEDENNVKDYGFRLNVRNGNKLTIKNDNKLWVSGYTYQGTSHGDTVFFHQGSELMMESTAQLNTYRDGKIIDSSANITWNTNAFMHIYEYSEISFWLNNNIINNGAHIEVDANGVFKVHDNSTVTFSGSGTYLKLNPNAIVQLGENSKIEFTNGAYLDANGTTSNRITFSSLDASHPGTGLVFTNAGSQTSITYCTFNNLKTSVKIVNDGLSTANIFRNISHNEISMNSYGQYGLHFYNVFRTNTQDNTITMTGSGGFGMVMRFTITTTHDDVPPVFAVNVLDNKVYNGAISAAFISTTSEYVPVNVSYNNFYYASYISAHGNHIGGDFRNNNIISSSNSCISMHLSQSTPNIYSNTLKSNYFNFNSIYSFQNMAPVQSDNDELIYLGGYNEITSYLDGNMLFGRGLAFLDYGHNCFTKVNNPSYKHLWGYVTINEPTDPLLYYMRNNDFNGASYPDAELIDYETNSTVYPMTDGSTFTCIPSTDYGTIWQVRDMGNGIYDTIYYKTDNTGTQPTLDESLYNTAILKKISDYYFDAITIFKSLINNYPESSYTDASLFNLYECYEGMDTSSNQGITNALYGDLKTFLEGKINSELYSETFNCDAYQLIAMCETKMIDYENAMEAYEFISLYHPEPYIRLVASWDFAELEAIMLGGSGISSKEENMTDAEYKSKLISKINEIIKEDPIKKKVKKSYDKISAENNERIEKQVYSKTSDKNVAKQEIAKLKSADDKITNKTITVLRYAKTMTKEERENRQIEDILYTPVEKVKNSDNAKNSSIPDVYSLSQNYPNPFNPVTKINYDLPKDGMVKLVVYDILGREVKTLVNEVKQAGRYTVEFSGSSLSSGIYFYKIQTGNFVQVKRMVLVK